MDDDKIYRITNVNEGLENEKREASDELIEATDNLKHALGEAREVFARPAKPYYKTAAFRWGLVIVAVTIVKTVGKVIIAKNDAKYSL